MSDYTDIASLPQQRNLVIDTPVFTLTFKDSVLGDNHVYGTKGNVPINAMAALADKLIIETAVRTVKIWARHIPHEAVVAMKAPKVNSMFDQETYKLKEEYRTTATQTEIDSSEADYAALRTYFAAAAELSAAKLRFWPSTTAKAMLQMAWDSSTGKGITDPAEAVLYRIRSGSSLRDLAAKLKVTKAANSAPKTADIPF